MNLSNLNKYIDILTQMNIKADLVIVQSKKR